jgi:FkbM family methyltransferase
MRWKLIADDLMLPILRGRLAGKRWLIGTRVSFFTGRYEKEQTRVFAESVHEADVVYDIGAHVGYYTVLASVIVGRRGRVIAFEPSPRNLTRLRKHVEVNRCGNVTILDVAVSDHEGVAPFEDRCGSGTGHLSASGTVEVRVVNLDALVARGEMPPPSVMKIDVEGAEAEVLAGATSVIARARPTLFLSTHSEELKETCYRLLSGCGYTFRPLDRPSVRDADEFLVIPPA